MFRIVDVETQEQETAVSAGGALAAVCFCVASQATAAWVHHVATTVFFPCCRVLCQAQTVHNFAT